MWNQQKLGRAALAGLWLGLIGAAPARAETPRPLGLRLKSVCPDRELLVSELSPLLRGFALSAGSADAFAEVEDLGESYRVSVDGASRTVSDPARRCLERARVAAVFLALNLPSSPTPAPAPALPPAPRPSSRRARAVPVPADDELAPSAARAFELRPFAQAETALSAGVASTGLGLAATHRVRAFAVTLLGAVTTSTTPYQGDGEPTRFELRRLPFAALLGWEKRLGLLGLGFEVGPEVDVLRFAGKAVPNAEQALRLNPGLRLNAVLRVRASRRLAAELMPVVSWYPRTYRVRVEPTPLLAETPRFWLGIGLGLNCQVWGG